MCRFLCQINKESTHHISLPRKVQDNYMTRDHPFSLTQWSYLSDMHTTCILGFKCGILRNRHLIPFRKLCPIYSMVKYEREVYQQAGETVGTVKATNIPL